MMPNNRMSIQSNLFDSFDDDNFVGKKYCKGCPLSYKLKDAVNSYGDFRTAKVVFVGEAPGENEEREGIPFVGRAGEMLRNALSEVGISEQDAVFANTCRCSPPGNRNPTKNEMQCCVRYLRDELKEFKGLVVLLGSVALWAVLGKRSILQNRGYGFFESGKKFLATLHPSFVLRKGEYRKVFLDDMRKAKVYLDGKFRLQYHFIDTVDKLKSFITCINSREKLRLAFDLETTSLNEFDDVSKVLSISFSDGKDAWFIPLDHPKSPFLGKTKAVMESINFIFKNKTIKLIAQGGKFDINFLNAKFGIETKNFWFDTQIAHFLLEGKSQVHSLKSCAWRYTDYGGYDIDITNLAEVNLVKVADYNAMDAFVTYKLMEVYESKLAESAMGLLTQILCPAVLAISEVESDGVKVDRNRLEKITDSYLAKALEMEERIHSYPEVMEMEEERGVLVNFRSSKQLGEVFKRIDVGPTKRTQKTGAVSTDKEALGEVKNKHPLIADLLDYREADKILTTYLKPYKEKMVGDVIHGDYWFTAAISGRLACRNPNFQNIPFDVRPVFMTKRDYFAEVDYSQIELRVLAVLSGDEGLLECFEKGYDIHERTRKSIEHLLKSDSKKKQRVKAKGVNFGIVYGISGFGLANELKISQNKAQQMIDTFYGLYPRVREFQEKVKRFVRANGYIETVFGRRRWFKIENGMPQIYLEKMYRDAINFPIQATASDLVLAATAKIWRLMREKNMRSRLCCHVHDMILFDVTDDELEEFLLMIKPMMENLEFDFLNVPLKVDIAVGRNWGELDEINL